VYVGALCQDLGIKPGYPVTAIISGEHKDLSPFNLMLVRIRQAMAHDTVYLHDPILTLKTDNVCWCSEIREYARDLCGYLKSLVSKLPIVSLTGSTFQASLVLN
jgi:hypothetical protein